MSVRSVTSIRNAVKSLSIMDLLTMNVGSEIEKLNQLRKDGALSDAEFATAKSKLLGSLGPENTVGSGVHLMGKAAYKFVNFKVVVAAIGGVIAVIFFFTFFLPQWQKMDREFDDARTKQKQFSDQVSKEMADSQNDFNKRRQEFDKDFEKSKKEMEDFKRKNGFK